MSRAKKNRGSGRPREGSLPSIRRTELNLRKEFEYIRRCARNEETRLVLLGPFVFFSTQTGDAWVLDGEDMFAACLARGGDPQDLHIIETPQQFGIEWPAMFAIDGDVFVVTPRDGLQVRAIHGYPTKAIADALAQQKRMREHP